MTSIGVARSWCVAGAVAGIVALPAHAQQAASGGAVYKCPGPPVLYTDQLTAQEARERGCKAIEGQPITVIQSGRPPAPPRSGSPGDAAATRAPEAKVDAGAQRARDGESRRILERELRREEERLADMRREYNNGEPERMGNERNYQKYLDRVADMKARIDRKEADVSAIKRELAKLPAP